MGSLTISANEVERHLLAAQLARKLMDSPLVAVSAVWCEGLDAPRSIAALDTIQASVCAGVPHMIMLDSASDPQTSDMIERSGAIVIRIDHDTEGGLARPYVVAAQLINEAAPNAQMIKFEAEKALFSSPANIGALIRAGDRFDIVTGRRSLTTWQSMPPYQVATELWLGVTIAEVLDLSSDTASGVLAMNKAGRDVFIRTTTVNSWPYLFITPYQGCGEGLRVGEVEVTFDYHPRVVQEEVGNSSFDLKRRTQADLMLSESIRIRGGLDALSPHARDAVEAFQLYLSLLKYQAE